MKKCEVIFSNVAEEIFQRLQNSTAKKDQTIAKGIDTKVEFLKINPYYGDPIAKGKIPREYVEKYATTNLFRVELPNFWRMIYTLTNDEEKIIIIAFVVDVLDHKEYDKKFNYRKR